jgi:hypothetical protein
MDEPRQNILRRIWDGLPVLFPLVALFHLLLLGYNVISFARQDLLDTIIASGTCVELLLYTLLWVAVCDRWRWAAIGYIVLTAANLLLQFLNPPASNWRLVSDALFPFDVLMCFFLLFYYKRFR